MRLSKYSVLLLALMAASSLLIPTVHRVGAVTYSPGVKFGDDFTFGELVCQGPPCGQAFSNITSFEFRVTAVSGPNVTLAQIEHFVNGTSVVTGNFTSNVQNGFNSLLVIAGGLSAGNRLFNATGSPSINATLTQVYAGAPRNVNVLEFSVSTSNVLALLVWDQASGILVQIREIFAGAFFFARVTSTNIWSAATSPYFAGAPGALHLSVATGSSTATGVSFTSVNNFTGTVIQSIAFEPVGLVASINQTSILLVPGSTVRSSITVTAPANIPPRLYFMTVTGSSGSFTDSVITLINVTGPGPRFGLIVSPSRLDFTVGSSKNATVMITSFNGLTGTVGLSAFASPAGPSTIFNPPAVTLTANITAVSTLTVGSTATGSFNITVLGTHASEVERSVLQVIANPSAVLSSQSLTLQPNGSNSTTLTIATDPVSPLLAASFLNPGRTLQTSFSVSTSTSSTTSGSNFTVSASPNSTTIVQGSSVTSNITVKSIGPNHGPIELTTTVHDPPGVYVVTIIATNGTLTRTANITVTVQDFIMTPSTPLNVPCIVGGTCTVTIGATPINGFAGLLSLSTTSSPGLSANLSSNTVNVPGSVVLSVGAQVVGNYSATVTGTNGSLSHNTQTISVHVDDFRVSASPNIVNTSPGMAVSSTIRVSPVNGFTGSVVLSMSTSPVTGLSCSLSGMALGSGATISGGSRASTLSCQGSGGTYTVTVIGTSGSIGRSALVTVNVQDFAISAVPAVITIPSGGSGSSFITISSFGGFKGNVTLSAGSPVGLGAVLTPASILMSGTSALKVTDITAAPGTYRVNVTGASDTVSHSTTVTVVVSPLQVQPPSFSQMLWIHRLSLSRTGGIETWRFGVLNPNSNVTIYLNVHIMVSDGSGVNNFTLDSGTLKLAPNKNLTNLSVSVILPTADLGDTFTWSAVIQWGTTPSLGSSSTANQGVPTSGTFMVVS